MRAINRLAAFTGLAAGMILGSIATVPVVGGADPPRWEPDLEVTWEIQLNSTPRSFKNVEAYDVDLFDTPVDVLQSMEDDGIRTICYFSAGSYESWRPDKAELKPHRGRKLGTWKGEWWIDIRKPEVRTVMTDRLDLAKDKGCDAVDPDNVDGYANRNGLELTEADQVDYLKFLAEEAHERGMAIGLKNAVDLVPQLVDDFDFTVNEECFDYDECGTLRPFTEAGKPVLQIQYGGKKQARRICPEANELGFSTLVKKLNLDDRGIDCQS